MNWFWWWIAAAVVAAVGVTVIVYQAILYLESDRPLNDWQRARAALGRAVDRAKQ